MKRRGELVGKVAFITGASRGIGSAIAEKFAGEGADLVLHCRKLDREEKLFITRLKRKFAVKAEFFEADFNDLADMKRMWREITKKYKRIDILVNNAGIYPDKTFFASTEESWDKVMNINLKTPYFLTQHFASRMEKSGGVIVNIVSVAGVYPRKSNFEYSLSKAALVHFTKGLAMLLAPKIRVNAIAPSYTKTGFMSIFKNPAEVKRRLKMIPMGHFNEPEDIANATLFFASDQSRYITGEVLIIDGGRGASAA